MVRKLAGRRRGPARARSVRRVDDVISTRRKAVSTRRRARPRW